MDIVPYRRRAREALEKLQRKKKQVYVVELHVPKWLPGVVAIACGFEIARRVRRRLKNKQLRNQQQKEEVGENAFGKVSDKKQRHGRQQLKHSYSCDYRRSQDFAARRSMSLPVHRQTVQDTDSAIEGSLGYFNEDSLSEFSRIPSPRTRADDDSQFSYYDELLESCFEDFAESPCRKSFESDQHSSW
eukprot:TRINITY_DN2485_c1_g1_i3.p3 TRINITY_DN2485_c1_g1~~TRINITY_DN2485_c1_g1_i3.p3  ORF type:complete len:188 (+),score=31.68 TRINITY_DN2485_c1_g1_i3:83-646(+)